MASQTKLIPAPKLKEYVFTDKLGSGTYATVYKAYKKIGSREVVAVKCVLKSSLNSISTENLLTEIDLLKTLNHENIVTLKDFSWDEHYIYLIMEYCSGGDLSRFIRARRTLPETVAKRFLQQLALALQYMRAKNVSHMDLKPQNILLSTTYGTPQLKIADFGFAHYLIGDTEASFIRGSPLYMAPEIVLQRQYNEKADLWSVGIIIYECIFGRAPFASRSMKEVVEKIKDPSPIELPYGVEISRECRDLLHGLLQRDPDKRISYEEFLDHPFIDLKHRPAPDALKTAISLATEAVKKDNAGEYAGAVTLYCQALEYFVPAIHYEHDPKKKQALRGRVQEYMARAEELKLVMKPNFRKAPKRPPAPALARKRNKNSDTNAVDNSDTRGVENSDTSIKSRSGEDSRVNSVEDEDVELGEEVGEEVGTATARLSLDRSLSHEDEMELLCEDHPHLQAAFTVLWAAQELEEKEVYDEALDKYELALESMLKLLKDEPKGQRRKLLQSQINRWMFHAEAIKNYIKVKDLNLKDTSEAEEKDNEHFYNNLTSSCCVQ